MKKEERAKEYWHMNHEVNQVYDNDEHNAVLTAYRDGYDQGFSDGDNFI